ncbi:MAG: hypothetical protein KKB31_07760 [Nanoarchaeota archaeon]|nr:hypothetical protein [Nanoarchaeota archaeon]
MSVTETTLALPTKTPGGMIDVAQSRQAQEVQAAMVIAKKFPRDEIASQHRILAACKRKSLAESAVYSYPRGGSRVEGPSIRLAEVLAQAWGNIDSGIIELEQRHGESTVMAYAWDLETNARSTKVFTVKHERRVGKGDNFHISHLADPRDIYEMVANQGARRLRSCIMATIPGDVIEAAVVECNKTMAGPTSEPIKDRVIKMVGAFGPYGVSQQMIEASLNHKLDATSEAELAGLRKIFTSIKDGASKAEQWFPRGDHQPSEGKSRTDALVDRLTPPTQTAAEKRATASRKPPTPPTPMPAIGPREVPPQDMQPEAPGDDLPFDEWPPEEPEPPQQTGIPYVSLANCVRVEPGITVGTLGKIKFIKPGKTGKGTPKTTVHLYDGPQHDDDPQHVILCTLFANPPAWAVKEVSVDVQEMESRDWLDRTYWTIKQWKPIE